MVLTLEPVVRDYLKSVREQRAQTNSTDELSYRVHLHNFLRSATEALGREATYTGEPRLGVHGRPDFEAARDHRVFGYVEAEALGADLAHLQGSALEQNERFRSNLHNFLQTNHLDFRLFIGGDRKLTARLPDPGERGTIHLAGSVLEELQQVLVTFLDAAAPPATSPEAIATQLARRARLLRVAADALLSLDESPLHPFWRLYQQTLFSEITKEKFADVYAQTFTYGLFLAWLNTDKRPFDRQTAIRAIPGAVPPIQMLLEIGGGTRLPDEFTWIVDGICSDLDAADRSATTKRSKQIADPLVYFYETFLAAYDSALRERAGVYYTPDPVVDFIVRAVDYLLKTVFGKAAGLADPSVRALDPALGTATFLARAYRQVYDTMRERGESGMWPDRARNHLAKHFFGFERLPAAYTLAHVKLRHLLSELGVELGPQERLPVFLADTMMNRASEASPLPGADVLSHEIREAKRVRDDEDVLVVLGNPPYFGKSDNSSKDATGDFTFIGRLVEDYKYVGHDRIRDRGGLKWLQNDYVKFIRFAQWRIEQTRQGLVAYITDNSYLLDPVCRGMRHSLLTSFADIFVLNLHGCSKPKEYAPDGGNDANVFDIREGVAVLLCVRHRMTEAPVRQAPCLVHYADVWGTRDAKYEYLRDTSVQTVAWLDHIPAAPRYEFVPSHSDHEVEYDQGWSLSTIFDQNGDPAPGLLTTHDSFAVAFTKPELERNVATLLKTETEVEAREHFALCSQDQWNYEHAKRELALGKWHADIAQVLYRPFDVRWTAYNKHIAVHRRERVMRHMLQGSIGLAVCKRVETHEGFHHVFVCRSLFAHHALSLKEINYVMPLWLSPDNTSLRLDEDRRANLSSQFVAAVTARVSCDATMPIAADSIFAYIYGVIHAPTYRERYAPFLKKDFPKVPLPTGGDAFRGLAAVGERLIALHLLEAPDLAEPGVGFPVAGDHTVQKMRLGDRYVPPQPDGKPGRVRLNEHEYFDNVPPEAWEFRVGGYQPAAKWLDDRAGRKLTEDDIEHYRRVIAAMRQTVVVLPEADRWFRSLVDR